MKENIEWPMASTSISMFVKENSSPSMLCRDAKSWCNIITMHSSFWLECYWLAKSSVDGYDRIKSNKFWVSCLICTIWSEVPHDLLNWPSPLFCTKLSVTKCGSSLDISAYVHAKHPWTPTKDQGVLFLTIRTSYRSRKWAEPPFLFLQGWF